MRHAANARPDRRPSPDHPHHHRATGPASRPRWKTWFTSLLAVCVVAAGGGAVFASAATPSLTSPFDVRGGTVRPAEGTPAPASRTDVALWSNGSSAAITLKGPGRLVIGATGTYCQGWPILQAKVDGKVWWRTGIVDTRRYGRYPMGPLLPAGEHRVEITLYNDFMAHGCDRNAFLASAFINPAAGTPGVPAPTTPAPTTPAPTTPAPTTPAPTTPAPTTPAPTKPAPTKPAPTKPAPTTPAPTTPPSGGTPNAGNTGVPNGKKLTAHQGDLTITEPGTVVDGLDVRGAVRVKASDVTIKNTFVRGDPSDPGALLTSYGNSNVTVVDSTIRPDKAAVGTDAIKGGGLTIRRVEIANVIDGMQVIGGNVLIENSWFHSHAHFASGVSNQPDGKTHDDSVQVESGTNVVIRNSRLEDADNAALMVTQNAGPVRNLLVTGNYLAGGQCTVNIDEKSRGKITNSQVSNNKFGNSLHNGDRCPLLVPRAPAITFANNVFAATNKPALPRQR